LGEMPLTRTFTRLPTLFPAASVPGWGEVAVMP